MPPPPENPSATYRPAPAFGGLLAHYYDGKPWFTYWDVPRMTRDSFITLLLDVWCGPYRDAEFVVTANRPEVKAWVERTLKFFWAKGTPTLLRRYACYGYAPAGLEYAVKRNLWHLAAVRPVAPADARAVEARKSRRLVGFDTPTTKTLLCPYAFWFAGHGEQGGYYDTPPLAGAFDPWLEANTRDGAKASRQLHHFKYAYEPGVGWYPPGKSKWTDPTTGQTAEVNNQDVMARMLEMRRSGSNLWFPSAVDEKGNRVWDFKAGGGGTDAPTVYQYPKDLKEDMAEGLGVPPEVLRAAETGSGYSGRDVPRETWLGAAGDRVGLLVDAFDRQCLRPVGRINFGRGADWEIAPVPLLETKRRREQPAGGRPPGGGAAGPAGPQNPAGGGGGGDSGTPYQGPRGGRGVKDPVTGSVRYESHQMSGAGGPDPITGFDMSAAADPREAHALAALAMVALQQEAHAEGHPHKYAHEHRSLAELAKDPAELLRVAGGGHPDGDGFRMAFDPGPAVPAVAAPGGNPWVRDPGPRSQRRWKNSATGAYRYQDTQPGLGLERRAKAVASGERGRKLALLAAKRGATAEHLAELADHLPAMRVADLRQVRALLEASFENGRRRDEMARALVDHVRGRAGGLAAEQEDTRPFDARSENFRRAEDAATQKDADEFGFGTRDPNEPLHRFDPAADRAAAVARARAAPAGPPPDDDDHALAERAAALSGLDRARRWQHDKPRDGGAAEAVARAERRVAAGQIDQAAELGGMTDAEAKRAMGTGRGAAAADALGPFDGPAGPYRVREVAGWLDPAEPAYRVVKAGELGGPGFKTRGEAEAHAAEKNAAAAAGTDALEGDAAAPAAAKPGKKKALSESTLAAVVKSYGGIDPDGELLRHFSGVKEAVEAGIPLGVFRKGGESLDLLAPRLIEAGHLDPHGPHADPGEHLLKRLREGVLSFNADQEEEHERAYRDYLLREAEAHEYRKADPEGTEEALRRADEVAARLFAEDPLGEAGGQPGEGHPDAHADLDFPFGANAPAEPEPAKEPDFHVTSKETGRQLPAHVANPAPTLPPGHKVLDSEVVTNKHGSHRVSVVANRAGERYVHVEAGKSESHGEKWVAHEYHPVTARRAEKILAADGKLAAAARRMYGPGAEDAIPTAVPPDQRALFGGDETEAAPGGTKPAPEGPAAAGGETGPAAAGTAGGSPPDGVLHSEPLHFADGTRAARHVLADRRHAVVEHAGEYELQEKVGHAVRRHGTFPTLKAATDAAGVTAPKNSSPAPLDNADTKVRTTAEGSPPDSTNPAVNDDGSQPLEGVGGGSPGEGLFAGQRLGEDAAAAPQADRPGEGGGTGGGGRPASLPAGADGQRDGAGGEAGGRRDAAGDGAGTGDGGPPAPGAGRRVAATHGERTKGPRPAAAAAPVVAPQSAPEEVLQGDPTPAAPTDLAAGNFRYDSTDFAAGGLKAKYAANVAAIKTLAAIKAEGRDHATPAEQAVMARFVGWGQFPAIFNSYSDRDWEKEREQLRGLLSPAEWDAARKSTLNAHYTHPDIVAAHWRMADKLGFKGGRYLETSAGVGYYLGMMPPGLAAKTHATAVEQDPTTGGMLKHLYPAANVQVGGFEHHQTPDDFYDFIASNVPFGDYGVHDPRYNKHQAEIHDYFFLKSADKVRPGGIVQHITSAGTLDKADPKIRQELHKKGLDLVAAVRFPGKAHEENAGTSVVTDMLVFRKRLPGEAPGDDAWTRTTTAPDPDGGDPIPVNQYFADNPAQVLGRLDRSDTLYKGGGAGVSIAGPEELSAALGRPVRVSVQPNGRRRFEFDDGSPVPSAEIARVGKELFRGRLQAAIDRLPAGVMTTAAAPADRFAPEALPAPGQVKDGGFHVDAAGKVYVKDGGGMSEVAGLKPAESARLAGHLGVRDALRAVLNAQIAGRDAGPARAELNRAYDAFVKKYGPLNGRANQAAFREDPDAPVLLALEKYDPETKTAAKADVFHRDTISPAKRVEKAGTVAEAVGVSLHETGGVDVKRIAALTGHDPAAVGRHLVASGTAYEDPSHGWQPAAHYLSGNVRRKLVLARAAAAADPKFAPNVAALEKVQPADVEHTDIEVKLGAPWVPPEDVKAFAAHLLDGNPDQFAVNYLPQNGQWMADYHGRGRHLAHRDQAAKVWGTPRRGFMDLLEPALNNTPVTVYDKLSDGTSVVNKEATDDANAKIQDIKEAFKGWLWEDDARRDRLHRHYNDNFNNVVPMKYDGAHLQLPGKNPAVALRDHQKNAVWQTVTTGTGLLAHEVGTGKTYSMIAAAMELRRLGLARKPAIACLKANVEAITQDALHLYPGARILSTADMFDAASRKKTISRIATGDYDMVVLTHDHLDLLQMKPETVEGYIRGELEELEAARAAAHADNPKRDNRVVKQLEKAKARLEARLKDALDAAKKDDAVYFEETGIDHLFVDEAHKYKSLPCYTKQDRLKGVPTSRSDKATAMQMRTRWLQERNGGRGVTFATGTPVGNTMAELYNMQRYLQPGELKERGIDSFDAWAATFGDVVTKMEFTATGEYKPVSRFARFTNIPELMNTARQVMDVQRAAGLKNADGSAAIKRPKRKDEVTTAPKSPAMALLMEELQKRAADLKGKKPGDGGDNMLAICTDGRKGALDMRMVYAAAKDHPDSKTNKCVGKVLDLYKANPGKTQMIFSDLGANPQANGFHLYKDVIDKLVAGGVPRDQIADFSQLEGAKKDAAVQAMREGKVRVAIGSTQKLGTGVNAQHKLLALHHLDVPWLPADVEQRDGRGWRHGNENKEVQIHRYVTEGSLDQMFWQIIGNKARFIAQVMTPGASVGRVAADEDTEELSPEHLMAAASGDPDVMRKVQADQDVKDLAAARTRHDREQAKLKRAAADAERLIPEQEAHAKRVRADADALAAEPDFGLLIDGQLYEDRKDAEAALAKKVAATRDPYGHGVRVGSFRGLGLYKAGEKLELRGEHAHPTGDSLASVESVARRIAGRAEDAADQVRKAREGAEKVKAQVGRAFPKAAELAAAEALAKELEAKLKEKAKPKEPEPPPAPPPAA